MANIGSPLLPGLQGSGASGGNFGHPNLPLLTGSGRRGLTAEAYLPLLLSSGQGKSLTNFGVGILHRLTSSAHGNPGVIGHASARLPLLTSSAHLFAPVPGSGAGKLPILLSGGHGLPGVVGKGAMILPLLTSSGNTNPDSPGQGYGILPMIFGNGHGDVILMGETYNRKAIVMHLLNYAVSHYVNFNFNSLFLFNGLFLGTNEQGVFVLDGNDDLGELIQAEIGSGVYDIAKNGVIAKPREAWLAYRSTDGMALDVKADETIDLPTVMFNKTGQALKEDRGKLGRGIEARFLTLKLHNMGGCDFSMESLRILGDILKGRTR